MTEINRPDVVSEVRNAFDRYNAAIDSKDVVALTELFWKSDCTVRSRYSENLFGHDAIVPFPGPKWPAAPKRSHLTPLLPHVGPHPAAPRAPVGEPARRASDGPTPGEVKAGWKGDRLGLQNGTKHNGASIDWVYRGGGMQRHVRVYGRADKPCFTCGTPIHRITVGQRGTHFSPHCQAEH